MDVAFFNFEKKAEQNTSNKGYLGIVAVILSFALLLVIAYFICIHLGLISKPNAECCLQVLEFNFDFDIEMVGF